MKPSFLSSNRLSLPLASAIAAMLTGQSAQAQTWSGLSSGAWLTTGNWTGGVAAGATTAGDTDIAVFSNNTQTTVGINMNTTGGVYHLGALDYTGNGARTLNNSSTTVAGILTLNGATVNSVANTIIRNTNTALMTITNGTGTGTLGLALGNTTNNIINISGTGGIAIASIISGAADKTLTKTGTGAGSLSLTGANTYAGVTNVSAGTLGIGHNTALGTTAGNTVVASGATAYGIAPLTALAEAFNISGTGVGGVGAIRIGGGGVTNMTGAVTLAGNATIGTDGGVTLTMSGGIDTAGNTLTLAPTGTALNINTVGISGTNGNVITSGAVNFNVANSYTGNTTISGGVLTIAASSFLQGFNTSGRYSVSSGATLAVPNGVVDADVNTIRGTGNFTLGSFFGFNTSLGNRTFGSLTGGAGVHKIGANTLTLSDAANSYTGPTSISGGILSVSTLANAGANSSIGAFATAGATGLFFSGGTLSYTGASTTIDRGFTHNGNANSTINISGNNVALVLGATTIASNDNFKITGGTGSSLTIGPVTLTSAQFNPESAITTNVGNLTFSANTVIVNRGSGTVNFADITGTGSGTAFLGDQSGTSRANYNGVVGGFSGAVSIGGANVSMLGLNTYTGATGIQSGVTTFNTIKNVSGGASSLGAPTTVAAGTIGFGNGVNNLGLTYNGTSGDVSTDRVLNLRGTTGTVTLTQAGTGLLKFTSNLTATGAGSKTLALSGSTTGTGELAGAIVNNSGTNITSVSKTGNGTWTLSGTNTYTGVTTLTGGTLSVATIGNGGVAGNLGQATAVVGNLVFDGGTLDYTGSNATSDRAFTIIAGKTATINSANNLSFAGATGTATTGGLTKTGAGVLTLTGNSNYTGITTLTGGSLSVATIGNGGTAGGLGAATNAAGNIVFDGGTLNYTGSSATSDRAFTIIAGKTATINSANNISFAGATGTATTGGLTKTGAGVLTLTGNSTYTGITTLTGGTLSVATINNGGTAGGLGAATNVAGNIVFDGGTLNYTGSSATSDRAFTIIAGKTATINSANNLSFAGATGTATTGGLTKTGDGALTLTGTNTYTGSTLVSGGSLIVNGSISTSLLTTVASGATIGGDGSTGALTVQSGGFIKPGNSPGILETGDYS